MPIVGRLTKADALRIHPETALDNFTKIDCDLVFFTFIRSIYFRRPIREVLDFGAGRNEFAADFDSDRSSNYIRHLRDYRFGGAKVTAADVDEVVLHHPTSDDQVLLRVGTPLPFESDRFDLIVSDYTFEHIDDPGFVCSELARVVKPGGFICARTPNKYGYVKLAAQLVPNSLHASVLRNVQPHRKAQDVFPTVYKLNSVRDVQRHFPGFHLSWIRDSWEPAYFFGNRHLYRLMSIFHRFIPQVLSTGLLVFLEKPAAGRVGD